MNGMLNKEKNRWPKSTVNIYLTCDTGEMVLSIYLKSDGHSDFKKKWDFAPAVGKI